MSKRYIVNYNADEALWEITDAKTWQAVAQGLDKEAIEAEAERLNNE